MTKVGSPGEPVAELTGFGLFVMSPGNEIDLNNLMLSRTPIDDYEKLCNHDVLRVEDIPKTLEEMVHTNFKEKFKQSDERWYKTGLLWMQGKKNLQNNETRILRGLQSIVMKLQKSLDLLMTLSAVS